MADNQEHIKPTADLIRQYLAGTLDDKTMHALEKQALDDPFLAEALEGYAMHPADQRPALADLQARLEKRAAPAKVRRLDYRWLAAAGVLLFIAISALFIINRPPQNEIAQVKDLKREDSAAAVPAPAAADHAASEKTEPTTVTDTTVAPRPPVVAPAPPPSAAADVSPAAANSSVAKEKAADAPLSIKAEEESTSREQSAAAEKAKTQAQSVERAYARQAAPQVMKKSRPLPALKQENTALAKTYTEKIDTIRIGRYAGDTNTYALQPSSSVEGKITGAPNQYRNYYSEQDERLISGVVIDAKTGRRLPGVAVREVSAAKDAAGDFALRGAVTDTSGFFALKAPRNKVKLDFSMIGYEQKKVEVAANDSQLNVKLPASKYPLAESVVVGYGAGKRYGAKGKPDSTAWMGASAAKPGTMKIRGRSDLDPGFSPSGPRPAVSADEYGRYLASRHKLVIPGLLENKPGRVRLAFTVTPAGGLKDFEVLESMGDVANRAAIRIIQEGPKWLPAPGGKDARAEVSVMLLLLKQE